MRRSLFLSAVVACVLGMTAGCSSNPPLLTASDQSALDDGYRIDAGDKLRITVYNEVNLTGEYNISTSGGIAFPLIGIVPVKGQTIEAASEGIRQRLSQGFVNDPKVSIEVLNYRPYYILGEVSKPGEYPYVNGRTIEQAIATAGGFTYRANHKTVFLRRNQVEGERTVKLRQKPIQVLPGDTIRVGERYF